MVRAPSPEWSDGAATSTLVPAVVAPPSSSHVVVARPPVMPENASTGESVTVVSALRHPDGASLPVAGAPASIRTVTLCGVSGLPATSVLE